MSANISFVPKRHFVHDIAATADNMQELADVLQRIVQNAGALLEVRSCSIALIDATGSTLVTLAALQDGSHKLRQTRFRMNEGVAGWVAEHRQALVLNDVELDERFKSLGRIRVGSIMCVPLINNGDLIGTLTASSQEKDAFDEKKVRLFTIFADQAVLSIVNARRAKHAQRQASQLELLLRLSRRMTTRLESETLYHTILANVRQLVPCEHAVLYLYQEQTRQLYAAAEWIDEENRDARGATYEEDEEYSLGPRFSDVTPECINMDDENSLPAWAALHRHPMLRAPMQNVRDGDEGHAYASAELVTPLVSNEDLYGVLRLKRKEPFSSEELRLVRNLSNMTATALENVDLFHEVRSEQEELRAILAASSDGIATLSVDGSFIEANDAFGRIFGLAPEQVVGMECMELFGCHEEGGPTCCKHDCMIQRALQQKEPLPYVEVELDIQETQRSVGLSIASVTSARKPLCLLVARDVTTIRDATRMKAKFLSMVTHELRSPINAINGYLDLTLEGIAGELNEQQREFLWRARAGSEHLYSLVEDLLLVSRADAGQLRLSREIIRLQPVIINAVEEMELTAKDQHIDLNVAIPNDFPRLYADAVRLQQVLRNLLSNALRFTAAEGQVTISARVECEQMQLETGQAEEVTVVKLSVSDTGCGIAPEFQQRIFERFFQIPNASGGRTSGQGLGLAIVKMIVELHGGYVAVESEPEKGSTFTCTLPCLLS